jgi:catechol 2,3-dioxygenase-like lactoylglutathione lyase family enzyme
MKTVFVNTIVFVKDLERSKAFYRDLLGQKILEDFGSITFFENQLVLHQASSIIKTVFGKRSLKAALRQGRRNVLIYFETKELESMFSRIKDAGVPVIHGIEQQAWGQKVFRFFDPDRHIVEIGEPLHTK